MDDQQQQRPALWFHPGEVDTGQCVAGLYRVNEHGQPEVNIHGSWSDGPGTVVSAPQDIPLLHGNAFGKGITAVDNQLRHSQHGLFSNLQDTTLIPRYTVEGGFYLNEDELALTQVRVRFWDQDAWSLWDAFVDKDPDRTRFPPRVEFREPLQRTAEVAGGTIGIEDDSVCRSTRRPNGWIMESYSAFTLTFTEPVSIDDIFMKWLVPLQFLIMSATGRPTGIRTLRGTNDAWVIGGEEPGRTDRWVDIRTAHALRPQGDLSTRDLLHLLPDFDFATQIPLVLEVVEQHRYSVEHFAVLRGGGAEGHLARLVAAAQLVESFDRSLHRAPGGVKLEDRLLRLNLESGEVLDEIVGHKRWAKDVVRVRDVVVHGLETSEQLTRDVRPLQVANEVLLLLFEVRLLVELGFDKSKAKGLIERRASHWEIKAAITENYAHLGAMAKRVL
jgi:hypothetical protein